MESEEMDEDNKLYAFKPYKFELVIPNPSSEVPRARSGHRIVCNAKYLYLFGGYNPLPELAARKYVFQELWKFNIATRRWEKCAEGKYFPKEVVSVAAIRRRQKLLIFGGTGVPFGLSSSNDLHSINLEGETGFREIEILGKGPERLYGQAIIMNKNTLYTIGGTNGFKFTCDIYRVNLSKDPRIWRPLYKKRETEDPEELLPYQPEGRYRHEVGFDGENIYVLGGGNSEVSYDLIDIPVFNLKSRTWQKLRSKGDPNSNPEYPQARRCHGVVQVKTEDDIHIFVMGGYQNNEMVFNDLWKLELSTLQWKLIQSPILPKALFLHSITLTREGKMYVFGGIKEGPIIQRTNEMYAAWTRIPKLAEIAWEALLYYFPRVHIKEVLDTLQLPNHFMDRLE